MRKVLLVTSILTLVLCLIGCGNENASNEGSKAPITAPTKTPTMTPSVTISATPSATKVATDQPEKRDLAKYRISDVIHSEALKNNVINEKTDRQVYVYLPPSYFESEKSYPVIYYLHGFGETPNAYFNSSTPLFDQAAVNGDTEFIVVYVDGACQYGGCYYVNSQVTGNWEDYVVNEVIQYVDSNYRTIANKDSRGICGFSMGGYGALHLAMEHPDIFGAVLSMSPGLIADGDISMAMDSWDGDVYFRIAYGRAFSPNLKDTKNYANIPTFDGSKKDNKIVAQWENGFGNLKSKVDSYLSKQTKLKAIKILYGELDSYKWIPRGCEALAQILKDKGVECELEKFAGGHSIKPNAALNDIVPYFSKNLVVQ